MQPVILSVALSGAVHKHDCNLDDRIPSWMVVTGSVAIGYIALVIFKAMFFCKYSEELSYWNMFVHFIELCFIVFNIVWLIIGSVWILGKYDDWDDAGRLDCET